MSMDAEHPAAPVRDAIDDCSGVASVLEDREGVQDMVVVDDDGNEEARRTAVADDANCGRRRRGEGTSSPWRQESGKGSVDCGDRGQAGLGQRDAGGGWGCLVAVRQAGRRSGGSRALDPLERRGNAERGCCYHM